MVVFAVWTGNVYSPKLLCLCRNLEHARQVAEDHDGWVERLDVVSAGTVVSEA